MIDYDLKFQNKRIEKMFHPDQVHSRLKQKKNEHPDAYQKRLLKDKWERYAKVPIINFTEYNVLTPLVVTDKKILDLIGTEQDYMLVY